MKTLVVFCHPSHQSFAAAVLASTLDGLREGSHEVRVTDLYADGFDPVLSAGEQAHHLHPTGEQRAAIASYADDLRWCESLVLVYPTWWAGQPAMLKGWIDRVWSEGVAWTLPAGATRIRPLLRNIRRITVVTTHGSTKLVNAIEGEGGKRTVTRSLRVLCSRTCRTRWVAMYDIDRATAERRDDFLQSVRRRLAGR